MKVTIDTKNYTEAQLRTLVRQGIIDKSVIRKETLDPIAMEALQFMHVHCTNDELASMAGIKTATWVWNMGQGHIVKMYKLLIENMNITPSEMLIIQSAAHVMTRIQLRERGGVKN
jgi:hypothetical protein